MAVDDSPMPQRVFLNFHGDHFSTADNVGTNSTDVALSASAIDSLALADTALQNIHEDLTPQLGGDLDAQRQTIGNALNLTINGQATDYGTGSVGVLPAFVSVADNHTWNMLNLPAIPPFFPASMFLPPVVEFTGTHSIKTSLSYFGGGSLFYAYPTIQNDPATAGLTITGIYALLDQTTYRANGQDLTASGFFATVGSLPVFDAVAPNVLTGTFASVYGLFCKPTLNTGASINQRVGYFFDDFDGSGAVTSQSAVLIASLTKSTNNAALVLGQTTHPAGNYCVYQGDETVSRWNGGAELKQRIITGNRTLDLTDHYVLCNSASALAVTLPSAIGCAGRTYTIKNVNTGVVTVATTSSQTIDGATTYLLKFTRQHLTVQSDGANWVIVAESALVLGPELLRNATFNGGVGQWSAGAGWSAAQSILTAASVATALSQTASSSIFVVGKTYRVTYQIITATAGNLRFQFTGGTNDDGASQNAVGVFSEDITITQTITSVRLINAGSAFSGTICNVSVREVTV